MSEPDIVVANNPDPVDRDAILRPLIEYNESRAGMTEWPPFAVLLRDPRTNKTIGGLWGRSAYDWFFVELLVVPEHLRGRDIGTTLMQKAEEAARGRGCIGIWLDTFSFQAPGFYQKLGFTVFGKLDNYPGDSSRFFLFKRLDPQAPK
jgi:GNAT superfamily N-acetyltransferase